MAKAGLGSKNRYQQCIHMYLKRRDGYKEKYGVRSERYLELSKGINRKLSSYRRAIKRIEARDLIIKNLADKIYEFCGVSVWLSINKKDDNVEVAKNLFVKWGMENGIQGILLNRYIGGKGSWTASRRRMKFTKSFLFNANNKEMWMRFKVFMVRDNNKIAA